MEFHGMGLRAKLSRLFFGEQATLYNSHLPYTADYFAKQPWARLATAGKHTYGTPSVREAADACLTIGRYCSIAGGVEFWLGGNHRHDWTTTYPFSVLHQAWPGAAGVTGHPRGNGPIVVGSDVWIGVNARILSGVTIGDGAVIGMGAIVGSDVPPYAIAVGNPARVVKYRFSPDQITALLQIAWWDWPEDEVNKALPLMLKPDPTDFIDAHLPRSGAV